MPAIYRTCLKSDGAQVRCFAQGSGGGARGGAFKNGERVAGQGRR